VDPAAEEWAEEEHGPNYASMEKERGTDVEVNAEDAEEGEQV
jgi:hypothetical protein